MIATAKQTTECCTCCGGGLRRGVYYFQRVRVCSECYGELTEAERYEAGHRDDPLNAARGIMVGLLLVAVTIALSIWIG